MRTNEEMEDIEEYDEDSASEEYSNLTVFSFACEDCDYRWEYSSEEEEEFEENIQYCPMCGSSNTTQI